MNALSVIIVFRNEGEEVETTIQEIKRTAKEVVNIILVNDASEDQFDYRILSVKYQHVLYIENQERKGCAASREIGISACDTPYIFLIDAHMRFYDNHWWTEIVEAIQQDARAIYCCRCVPWDYNTKQESNRAIPYGAYLKFSVDDDRKMCGIEWIEQDLYPTLSIVDIPCVLGACYAASKEYWNYLRGLEGLWMYSYDEPYISLKAWMEGGKCRLLKNVQVGHLFREQVPYQILDEEYAYNRLFIASLLLPEDWQKQVFMVTRLQIGCIGFAKVKRMLKQNQQQMDELKAYYNKILKVGFERFQIFNAWVSTKIRCCCL